LIQNVTCSIAHPEKFRISNPTNFSWLSLQPLSFYSSNNVTVAITDHDIGSSEMTFFKTACAAVITTCVAVTAFAAPLKLTPADPQPSGLKEGLAVNYAFPRDVKTLNQANRALKKSQPGKPLSGLDYWDTNNGDATLTSDTAHNVVAEISGYVRFDNPGVYLIDFLTNDGLDVSVGGQQVGYFNGRQACKETNSVRVEVPQGGWYKLQAVYFQRAGTACLHMRMGKRAPDWMPNSAFGYK
jgi:hypothetical protein